MFASRHTPVKFVIASIREPYFQSVPLAALAGM
jgi:hypothetical protein